MTYRSKEDSQEKIVELSVATEIQSKTVAIEIDPFETMGIKETFEEDLKESDKDEASRSCCKAQGKGKGYCDRSN